MTGLILVLHIVTPHIHDEVSEDRTESEQGADGDIFNWLVDFFDQDLGEGHLEAFEKVNDSRIDLDIDGCELVFLQFYSESILDTEQKLNPIQEFKELDGRLAIISTSEYLQPKTGLRAPPSKHS